MNDAQTYPLSGVVVFFDNEATPREDLRKVLDWHGLTPLLPEKVTNEKALRQALSDFTRQIPCPNGHVWMIRGLKHLKMNGYEAKLEKKDETENDATQAFRVKIVNHAVVIENDTLPLSQVPMVTGHKQQKLQALYDTAKAMVSGSDVGALLTKIIRSYSKPMAISLRPMGGLYWVPDEHKAAFESFCDDLESACPGNQITPNEWRMNPKGLRKVKDQMVKEMGNEAKEIMEAVLSGQLGENALENRMRRCIELQDEVNISSEILGEFTERLQTVLTGAQNAATQFMMTR